MASQSAGAENLSTWPRVVAGGVSSGLHTFPAAAAACLSRGPYEEWPLASLTFVLELRDADGQLFFTAASQPEYRLWEDSPAEIIVKFAGAFTPGAGERFEKTDTASLFVKRGGADGVPTARVAYLFVDLPRQRIHRHVRRRVGGPEYVCAGYLSEDEAALDSAAAREIRDAAYWQPDATPFEPCTLFFVTRPNALPPTFSEPAHYEPHVNPFRKETCCTLACAIEGPEDSAAVVSATLSFRCGLPRDLYDYVEGEGNRPMTTAQLVALFPQLHWGRRR